MAIEPNRRNQMPAKKKTATPEKKELTSITTVAGEVINIPTLNWAKELKLLALIEGVLGDMSEVLRDENAETSDIIAKALAVAPDKVTEFVSVVLEQDNDWVEQKLDLPTVVGVVVPLLRSRLDLVMERVQPYITLPGQPVAE